MSVAGRAQAPAVQTSLVQRSASSVQVVPSSWAGLEQRPVAGRQTPATWYSSLAAQLMSVVAWAQAPAVQTSLVQRSASSVLVVPSSWAGLEQRPVAGWQTPATWHSSLA